MGFDLIRTIERQSLEAAHDSLRDRLETYRNGAPRAAGATAPTQASAAVDPADMFRRVEPLEIRAEDLEAGVLREAVSRGCGLIVRNLVPPEVCAQLRRVIDAMLDAPQAGQQRSVSATAPEIWPRYSGIRNSGTHVGSMRFQGR